MVDIGSVKQGMRSHSNGHVTNRSGSMNNTLRFARAGDEIQQAKVMTYSRTNNKGDAKVCCI